MKRCAKWIIGGILLAGCLVQLWQPERTNPPVAPGEDFFASNAPPAEVTSILRAACYDCHSYETRWPWYSKVTPLSWWVVDHVKEGRDRLNFSEWPHDRTRKARSYYRGIQEEVEYGKMPLPSYTWMHAGARLSEQQRQALMEWAEEQVELLQGGADDE
ncbi:MAG: heme-binding domain-containing protein [Verrucomicrobiae bacterium]|nr:heme-binding domain-containing protein [Verrucomicrobiae bacterium]